MCAGAVAWAALLVVAASGYGGDARGAEAGGVDVAGAEAARGPAIERRPLLPQHGRAEPASPGGAGSIVNTVLSLGLVLGLIFGCAAAFRRLSGAGGAGGLAAALGRSGRAPSGLVEILARYPTGRGHTLVLLRLDRRVLLLSQSVSGRLGRHASFSTLSEITDAEEVASILAKAQDEEGESMASRFQSLLGRFDEAGDELDAGEVWSGRRLERSAEGDQIELLDERAEQADGGARLRLASEVGTGGGAGGGAGGSEDAVGSLRRRLESLRMAEGE